MFTIVKAANGVEFLRSDFLSYRHGFSTRIGGVSTLPHTASLNLAFDRGDEPETVLENLKRFAQAIGVKPDTVVRHQQIHSATVTVANEETRGEGYLKAAEEGDGFVTRTSDVALAVATADCVPILLEDSQANVIGAVHAGWRGAASGIAAECVRQMCRLGADVRHIRAAVGPAIHSCCYEVGEDFRAAVCATAGELAADRHIRCRSGKLYADLIGLNCDFLREAGLSDLQIDRSDFCTCCHPELFYSHRFSKGKRGTMLSLISLQ